MSTSPGRAWALLALLVGMGGCVEVERPGGATGPQEDDPLSGPSLLRISQPVNGQAFARTEFTTAPGVRLLITGDFKPDHSVVVEAYQNNHLLPFSVHNVRIPEEGVALQELFLMGTEQHLATATAAVVFLELWEPAGRVISRDSVQLVVR